MNDNNSPVPYGDYPMAPAPAMDTGGNGSVGPRRYLAFVLRYWWIVLLTSVTGVAAAVCYLIWIPPTYVSTAKLYQTANLKLPNGPEFTEDVQNFLGTESEILKSTTLRENTLKVLRDKWTNGLPLARDGQPLPVTITVSMPAKASVFTITAASPDPRYTYDYLTALVTEYLAYKKQVRANVSGITLASITTQIKLNEADLQDAQSNLNVFERTNNLAVLEETARSAGSHLAALTTELSDLKLALQQVMTTGDKADSNSGTAQGYSNIPNPPPAASSGSNPLISGQNAAIALALLENERDRKTNVWRPEHPRMKELTEQIEKNRLILGITSEQNRKQFDAKTSELLNKQAATLTNIDEWKGNVMIFNNLLVEARKLQDRRDRVREDLQRWSTLEQNVEITRNIETEPLDLLEAASPPYRSRKPDITSAILLSVAGFVLGLGIIFLMVLRDDRFSSVVEINERLGDNIVGQVPEIRGPVQDRRLRLLQIEDERQMYAESYRSLRSAILFMATGGDRPKVILVTSALPEEGKSTITANLARALALGGSRVLLIDGDLRKGTLHELMGGPREPGLAELLRQPESIDRIIRTDSVPNLSFIACGSAMNNPGDLFLDPALDNLLARLRLQYDYVLIDSSPVFAADDAATLAPRVDGTLFVVRNRFSRAAIVREALDLLYQRQARVLGLVFNRANSSSQNYYYYKHAGYYYQRPAETG